MPDSTVLVVTTIAAPTKPVRALAEGALREGWRFVVVGDTKTPEDFALEGCEFFSVDAQLATGLRTARACPLRSYARKNIGYLIAAREGAQRIIETDDDNLPRAEFFSLRQRRSRVPVSTGDGWVNAYRWFTDANIWPRGLPLQAAGSLPPPLGQMTAGDADCPIQQGLADGNPDVDAIYRLLLPLPQSFRPDVRVALSTNSWCPFNSQNTTWWRDAFPLMYLPATCSMRMTDIWRSFVAQRIAWENGWSVLFHDATVWQDRNEHDLMRDFEDEVAGYLHNARIGRALDSLKLTPGVAHLGENLRLCYAMLVKMQLLAPEELTILEAWLTDLAELAEVRG